MEGNVGIGTTSPSYGLSVQNNYGATNNTVFQVASSTATNGSTAANLFSVSLSGVTNQAGVSNATGFFNSGSGAFLWNGKGYITASGNGTFTLNNNGGTGFSALQFGGTTSSFPELAVNGANLYVGDASGGFASSFGIGTSTPGTNLGVQGNGVFAGNLTATNITATSSITAPSLTISGLTSGSALFAGTGGTISQDNANYAYNSTNHTLTINSAGSQPTIVNNTVGNGVILRGSDSTTYGQLRIVANGGGWTDSQETSYFQMSNGLNNNVSFMGGTYGNDVALDRLQFSASSTQITDTTYSTDAVPTALFSLNNTNAGKRIFNIIGASAQSGDFFDITANGGSNGGILSVKSSGNIGIGTTTPTNPLTLPAGSASVPSLSFGDTATGFLRNGTGGVQFSSSGVGTVNFNNNGVGAGVFQGLGSGANGYLSISAGSATSPSLIYNNANAVTALTVYQQNAGSTGNILALQNSAGIQDVVTQSGNLGVGSTTPFGELAIQANAGTNYPGNNLFTIGSSTASATTTLFNVLNSGLVGIGTTSPASTFAVNGGGYIGGTLATPLVLERTSSSGNTNILFKGISSSVYAGQTSGVFAIGSAADLSLTANQYATFGSTGATINVSGNPVLTVASNSNVGVGTTTPGTNLGVQGSGVFAGNVTATNITATGTVSATGNGTFGYITVNGTSDSHFNGSSNVYLGSATMYSSLGSTPNLAVAGEINANASVIAAGGSYSSPAYQFYSSSNTGLFNTGSNGTSGIGFSVQGVEKGRFNSNGYLGILNTSPSYPVDVAGFINTDQYSGYKQAGNTILYASTTNDTLAVGASSAVSWMAATSSSFWDIAIGQGALGTSPTTGIAQYNEAIGDSALNGDTTGTDNVAFGHIALWHNTSGSNNTALGHVALAANTTGGNNVSIGAYALDVNTTGSSNVAIGYNALSNNTTGSNNVAIGGTAGGLKVLQYNLSATNTVAIGANAAAGSGQYNNQGGVYLGYQSGLYAATSSDYNTFLGYQSGYDVTSGNDNILLGPETATGGNHLTTGANDIGIGYNTVFPGGATAANQLNIGNFIFGTGLTATSSSTSLPTTPTGLLGIASTSPWGELSVNASAAAGIPQFVVGSSTATNLIVANSGNVGVGSTNPTQLLSVGGSNQFTVDTIGDIAARSLGLTGVAGITGATVVNNGSNSQLIIQSSNFSPAGTDLVLTNGTMTQSSGQFNAVAITPTYNQTGSAAATDLLINRTETAVGTGAQRLFDAQVGGVSKFTVLDTGNVGIGTTTPGTILGVQGSGVFAGNVTATNITATGTLAVSGTATVGNLIDTGITANSLPYINGSQQLAAATIGNGLTFTTGTLAVSTTSLSSGFFLNNGNSFGTAAVLGTNDNNTLSFETNNIPRAIFDTSGDFGIGTTSPYATLSVAGGVAGGYFNADNASATSTFAGGISAGNGSFNFNPVSGITTIDNAQLGALSFDADSGIVSWADMPVTSNSANGTAESYTASLNGNPLLTVAGIADGSGGVYNLGVGIATTSPSAALTVWAATSTPSVLANFVSSASTTIFQINSNGNVGVASTSPWARLSVDTSSLGVGVPEFVVGSSTRSDLIISQNGNVGIGTTSPVSPLSVGGSGLLATFGDVGGGATSYIGMSGSTNLPRATFGYDAGNGNVAVQGAGGKGIEFNVNNSTFGSGQAAVITTAGNFGIGSTTPWGQLSASSTSAYPTFAVQQLGSGPAATFLGGNVGIGTTSPVANLGLQGSIGVNASQLYLAANGNVGIGTTNPGTSALQVAGTSLFSSTIIGPDSGTWSSTGITASAAVIGTSNILVSGI